MKEQKGKSVKALHCSSPMGLPQHFASKWENKQQIGKLKSWGGKKKRKRGESYFKVLRPFLENSPSREQMFFFIHVGEDLEVKTRQKCSQKDEQVYEYLKENFCDIKSANTHKIHSASVLYSRPIFLPTSRQNIEIQA